MKPGYVYVATGRNSSIKVGQSKNPIRRQGEFGGIQIVFQLACDLPRVGERLAHRILGDKGYFLSSETFGCSQAEAISAVKIAVSRVHKGQYTKEEIKIPRQPTSTFGERPALSFRLDPQIKLDLIEMARREHRSLASYVEHVLSLHAEKLKKASSNDIKRQKNAEKSEKTI